MKTIDILKNRRSEIVSIAQKCGAYNVKLFGSVVREEDGENSDIDVLVSMEKGRTLLDLIGLAQDLEFMLHKKVDVLTDEGLSPYLAERIKAEAVIL